MTTTLIVLAHPDPRSFNGAWAEATQKACEDLGDTVLLSDLGAMDFNPVECARHYPHRQLSNSFDPLKAQEEAAHMECLPADVVGEIEKLRRALSCRFSFSSLVVRTASGFEGLV